MELLKKSIEELAANFTTRMDDFQKEVRTSMPAANPSSNINAQFHTFRSFVMTALESLQLQLQLLSRQQDDMEVRTRRKMLLVHGVSETHDEGLAQYMTKLLGEHLHMPDITLNSITRCHRLGRLNSDKPRAVIVKFRDQDLRDRAWYAKTKLKGSRLTLSEFMIKGRHEAFVAARKRFGVSQCWTRDGCVVVLGSDGRRHRVVSVAEVNAIPDPDGIPPGTSASVAVSVTPKAVNVITPKSNVTVRAKKPTRK